MLTVLRSGQPRINHAQDNGVPRKAHRKTENQSFSVHKFGTFRYLKMT